MQFRIEELQEKKEAAMTNRTLPDEDDLASSGSRTSKLITETAKPSAFRVASTVLSNKISDRSRRTGDQSLVRGLLDPKSSSLSLTALARTAALSGKRLMLEIRDDNPVRIVRVSTRGI
jgi:hypothetical protein